MLILVFLLLHCKLNSIIDFDTLITKLSATKCVLKYTVTKTTVLTNN